MQRNMFICSVIEQCREKADCCPHKKPHIKGESCVPRQCRYAPDAETIDCDLYDPAHPRAPIIEPAKPARTVEEVMREEQENQLLKDVKEKEETGEFVPLDKAAEEIGIDYKPGEYTAVAKDAGEVEVPAKASEKTATARKGGKQGGKKRGGS